METLTVTVDKEFGSAMGALFHQIITDMKVTCLLFTLKLVSFNSIVTGFRLEFFFCVCCAYSKGKTTTSKWRCGASSDGV